MRQSLFGSLPDDATAASSAAIAPWLRPIAFVFAGVYAVFFVLHLILLDSPNDWVMVALAGMTTAAGVAFGWRARNDRAAVAPWFFFVMAILVLLNSAAHLLVTLDPHQTTNIAIAIILAGMFLLSWRDFGAITLAGVLSFVVAIVAAPERPEWVHFAVHLAEAITLSVVVFAAKRIILVHLCSARSSETSAREEATRAAESLRGKVAEVEALLLETQTASEAKSRFLANMSHELRTPLNAIIGFADFLTREEIQPGKTQEYAGYIQQSGDYLLAIINQILDLAKAEAGRAVLDEETFDLAELIGEVRHMTSPLATAKSIQLEVKGDAAFSIFADRLKMKQTLVNLASNAIKFTPDAGRVTISTTLEDSQIVIAVRDTGIGMAPEDLPRVFEAFVQIDGEYSRRYSGTGLGLPLARSFARLHGGDITLNSALSEGTTAKLTLPRSRLRQRHTAAA